MSARRSCAIGAGLLLCAGLVVAPRMDAQGTSLFDPTVMHDISMWMNSRDLDSIRLHYDLNTHYPVDFETAGTTVHNVSVRSRGGGSRNASKLGLLVEFSRYATGQTLDGRRAIVLDNLWQDPPMLRERVAMALFTRMGVAAPLESPARVSINGRPQGVYTIVESLDDQFLARVGAGDGYLFEYHWLQPYYFEDIGNDLNAYVPFFEARTHDTEPLTTLYTPIRQMLAAINEPSDTLWRSRVEQYVDVPQLLTHVAVETFLSEFDGLLGYAGLNNFYIYRPTGSTRHQFFPWDRDNAFQEVDASIFRRVDDNILVRRALTYPDLYSYYLDALEQTARAASEDGFLENQIRAGAAAIEADAAIDLNTPFTQDQRLAAIAYLLDFARRRPGIVLAEVRAARALPSR
ncbi:MAG TPA: CotH kinase family protein [Vicinamibacterales bacterium]|jgi:spore coat protein CotH